MCDIRIRNGFSRDQCQPALNRRGMVLFTEPVPCLLVMHRTGNHTAPAPYKGTDLPAAGRHRGTPRPQGKTAIRCSDRKQVIPSRIREGIRTDSQHIIGFAGEDTAADHQRTGRIRISLQPYRGFGCPAQPDLTGFLIQKFQQGSRIRGIPAQTKRVIAQKIILIRFGRLPGHHRG